MSYNIIQPPFTLQFDNMARADLIAYDAWFRRVIPVRVWELVGAVTSTAGFREWRADLSPGSLEPLGQWLCTQAELRLRTDTELEEIRNKLTFPITIANHTLTTKTRSLAMDIGMYFSQVILGNLHGTRWHLSLKGKSMADYGQPVIVKFSSGPLNPVQLMLISASKAAHGERVYLRQLYDIWAGYQVE